MSPLTFEQFHLQHQPVKGMLHSENQKYIFLLFMLPDPFAQIWRYQPLVKYNETVVGDDPYFE